MAGNARSGRRLSNKPGDAQRKGSTHKTRDNIVQLFPDNIAGRSVEDFPPPDWLSPMAQDLWRFHLKNYIERGQTLKGCEEALARYCALEAMAKDLFKKEKMPTVGLLAALFRYTIDFYDTPSSQRVRAPQSPSNPFANNGKRG